MKKNRHLGPALLSLPVLLLTAYLGAKVPGRSYYLTATVLILEAMAPFLLAFEGRKPQARELVVIAVLAALAVAARVVIPLPNFKAIFAVIFLSGIAFGGESGFLVGAVAAFASNFFYGQGPYTPWQMLSYGLMGLLGGILFAPGRLPRRRWVMAAAGALAVVGLVGPLLDTCSILLGLAATEDVRKAYLAGLPVNLTQALATALTLLLIGQPMLEKLDRVKTQYGMGDGDGI